MGIVLGCVACGGPELGVAGESCRARSDCRVGLACVRDVCVPASSSLSVTGKDCYRVECMQNADCCASFAPDPSCDFYQTQCMADPMSCLTYRTLCVCNLTCEMDRCIDQGPGCTVDQDCPGLTEPFCVSGRCVECREPGDGRARCDMGACAISCSDDAECDASRFEVCFQSRCRFVGCNTDAECRAYLGLQDTSGVRAVCR